MTQLQLLPPDAPGSRPSGASDEWYTRWDFFKPLHEEFDFTIDVCATKESAKRPRFFDLHGEGLAVDGLAQSWALERVWCNPPYSTPNLYRWVEKCNAEAHRAQLIVALLPAWTDRPWWQRFIERNRVVGLVEVRFIAGRVKFGWPGNTEGDYCTGTFPSVLVVWRQCP